MKTAGRIVLALIISFVLILFGFLISRDAYLSISREWHLFGPALAACHVAWIVTGPIMFMAGLWVLGSVGRKSFPLLLGGAAAVVAGTVLLAGVLSQVIPCSGPS